MLYLYEYVIITSDYNEVLDGRHTSRVIADSIEEVIEHILAHKEEIVDAYKDKGEEVSFNLLGIYQHCDIDIDI